MRLSVVFELLLVFLFLAFAAARVIDKKNAVVQNAKKLRQGGPNRYCACTTNMCNCCRDFSLPVVPVKGPGCASIMYLKGDNMMISMSFGDRVLSNMTLTGPKPKPVCMTLPGGISQFCGRVYGISRTEKNFKACLGLELRALDDIEAALRVSCFKFGPKGVNLESAPPIPPDETNEPDDEDDEDDDDDDDDYDLDDEEDDDLIGLGGDLDDDDDDDDDSPNTVSGNEGNEVDSDPDYTGFSVLGEDFFGSFFTDEESRPKKKKQPVRKTGKPTVSLPKVSTTTRRPILPTKRPSLRPDKATRKPIKKITLIPRPSGTKIVATTATPAPSLPPVPVQQQSVYIQPIPTLPPKKHLMTSSSVTSTTSAPKSPSTTTEKLIMTSTEQLSTASTFLPDSSSEKVSDNWYVEQHSTQGPTLVKITLPHDEVKLPDWDVQKIEAIAAIAQQGVTSSVIHSSALTPDQKVPISNNLVTEEIRTEKYVPAPTESMLKAGSRPNESEEEEEEEEDDLLDGILDGGLDSDDENTESEESDESNKVTEDESKPLTATINVNTEHEKDETDIYESTGKPPKVKPPKKGEEEDEEEDENEESDDLFDGIIDDGTDDEEEEENKKGDKEEDDVEEEDEEDPKEDEEEEDILGAFVADPYGSDNEKDESSITVEKDKNKASEEESDEDGDFLSVLADDDEEEDTAAEVEDDDNAPTLKKRDKYPGSSTGNGTTPQANKSDSSASSSSSSSEEDKSDEHKHKNKYNTTTTSTTSISEMAGQQGLTSQPEVTTVEETTGQEETTSELGTVSEKGPSSQQGTTTQEGTVDEKGATGMEESNAGFTTPMTTEQVTDEDNSEKEGSKKEPVVAVPKSDQLLMMKVATKMKEPQMLRLSDLLGPKKKYLSNDKPISTSRTHRRMNLDRWAPI